MSGLWVKLLLVHVPYHSHIFCRESELNGKGTGHITHELVYQWLGGLTTPFWWSDAHVNNALVKYITAYTTLKVLT